MARDRKEKVFKITAFERKYNRMKGFKQTELQGFTVAADLGSIKPVTRPIHYLGSKMRLIDPILGAINEADPTGSRVFDLFAGSGTVSAAIGCSRAVTAVDIQEYSRILCSALLSPSSVGSMVIDDLIRFAESSELSKTLMGALRPMIEWEDECRELAVRGDLEYLANFLEYGSLIAFQMGDPVSDDELGSALGRTVKKLEKNGFSNSDSSVITRHFGGLYFSFRQAIKLDLLRSFVQRSPKSENRDILFAALLSTASDLVNTIGKHFAQPLRPRNREGTPKKNLSILVERDRSLDPLEIFRSWIERYQAISASDRRHVILKCDYSEALDQLDSNVGVVYADPPYTRDHYSRFYHVLETICLKGEPEVSRNLANGENKVSRGIYRTDRHQSPFCIKTQAPKAFSILFEKTASKGIPLVLSYSPFEKTSNARPRLMGVDDLLTLAGKYFRNVAVGSLGRFAHSKLGHSEANTDSDYSAEILVTCSK